MSRQALKTSASIFVALLLSPLAAQAHVLHAQAKLDRGKVVVEAKFDGDEPAEKAKVYLIGADGQKVLRGRTGSDGQLRFDVPPPGKYELLVDAGAGHQVKVSMTITEAMQPGPSGPPGADAPGSPNPILLSEGKTIEEAQQYLWLKITIGALAILAFAVVLKIVARRKQVAA